MFSPEVHVFGLRACAGSYADKKYLRGFGFSMWRLFDYVQNLL